MHLTYDVAALEYLSAKDKRLAHAIARIGKLERQAEPDVFKSLVHAIIGQQISGAAQATICARLNDKLGNINADTLLSMSGAELQGIGISHKKAGYILNMATEVAKGTLDLMALNNMTDAQVIERLSALKGIGTWTAEMTLIFSLQRPDVISFGDLGILRGMRMLYRHRQINRLRFERYKKRYSPYATVASLYLWRIADGALPELTDPALR